MYESRGLYSSVTHDRRTQSGELDVALAKWGQRGPKDLYMDRSNLVNWDWVSITNYFEVSVAEDAHF
jgi:hypothetical protein